MLDYYEMKKNSPLYPPGKLGLTSGALGKLREEHPDSTKICSEVEMKLLVPFCLPINPTTWKMDLHPLVYGLKYSYLLA